MTVCKGKLELCMNDSFDEITRLINEEGLSKSKASTKVSSEWNTINTGAQVKGDSLRRMYDRAINPQPKKVRTLSEKYPEIPIIDISVVDNTTISGCINCFAVELEADMLKQTIKELRVELASYADIFAQQAEDEDKQRSQSPAVYGLNKYGLMAGKLPREVAFSFIVEHGNTNQRNLLTISNPKNAQVLNVLKIVIEERLKKVPHSGIPQEILEATEVV